MEESEEILITSLVDSGVSVPPAVSSINHLTPATLYVICSNALRLIDPTLTSSYPTTLPEDSMADRVKICTDLASSFKNLGFVADLSFHKVSRQFLYPSEDDLYKLVRFLVGSLSESSVARIDRLGDEDDGRGISKEKVDDEGESLQKKAVVRGLNDLRMKTLSPESSDSKSEDDLAQRSNETNSILQNGVRVKIRVEESRPTKQDLYYSESRSGDCSTYSSRGVETLGRNAFRDRDCPKHVLLQDQEDMLEKQLIEKSSDSLHLEEEVELLKTVGETLSDSQQPMESYIDQLNNQVEAKRCKLKELESEWDAIEKPLQEKKRHLKQSLHALYPEVYGKFTKTKKKELETEYVIAEIKQREEEISKLLSDLGKQPKMAPRRSYIERIIEITKNSKKQEADIQRVLKDTRELQLESNTLQERHNRTYAVVDETIFREAKKDPVALQAYRLLTSIHESFEQIAEKVLATDRSRRDVADYEAKLAIINARSLNTDKLQADLDAIRKVNDLLEQRLHTI